MALANVQVERDGRIGWIWLNRPEARNALSEDMWEALPAATGSVADEVDVIVVAGRGPDFTVGIDLGMLASLPDGPSEAARNHGTLRLIERLQASVGALERVPVPVIAAVHGNCLGAGLDLITACDIRMAAADAVFSVRETRMGLVADLGVLQRLPRIVGAGRAAELAFTGRDMDAAEAERIGLVGRVLGDVDALISAAGALASEIAANPPLVVRGVKRMLLASRDLPVDAALEHVALWNAAFLRSDDLREAVEAFFERRPPDFTGT